jgi:hypothetical protein
VFGNGRGWCRQCGWKGDSIAYLRDKFGLSYHQACQQLQLPQHASARRCDSALDNARVAYQRWKIQQVITLTDDYRATLAWLECCEIAYRAVCRSPALYSEAEQQFWEHELASVYDLHAQLETQLAMLSESDRAPERIAWFREAEQEGGEHE